jgi:hypothetical protein
MAKVKHISQETIKALAGIIDFYYWKGIPCARKWPDWTHFKPSPRQKASIEAFKKIREDIKKLQIEVVNLWRQSCVGKTNSWVDLFTFLWFQFWKAGIDPAPVLTRYRISETTDTIFLEMDFTAPVQSHIAIADGYHKGTRRITPQKGRPQPCWDPPKPKQPRFRIEPIPIIQPTGAEEKLILEFVDTQGKIGYGRSMNYEEAVHQAWWYALNTEWTWPYIPYPGFQVDAYSYPGMKEGQIIYFVSVYIRRDWYVFNDDNWTQKYPDVEPNYITDWGKHSVILCQNCDGILKIGYAEWIREEFKPNSYYFFLHTNNPEEKIVLTYDASMKGEQGKITILFEIDEDLYYTAPPPPPLGQSATSGFQIKPNPSGQDWVIGKSAEFYTASIPKSAIQGLSQPTAFIYSHNRPAVAPPIPL